MKIDKFIYFICSVLLIITVMITCVDVASFDRGFYKREYEKYNNAEVIGVSEAELDEITEVLLGYIQDKNDDLTITATVHGNEREVFNEKEKLHMVDVKNLYLNAINVRNYSFIAIVICLGVLLLLKRFDFNDFRHMFGLAALMFLGLIIGISLWAVTDFDAFWVNFHYVFFDNDLFFLDPAKDILIMMVPGDFFFDLVFRIIMYFVGSMGVLFGGGYLLAKRGV